MIFTGGKKIYLFLMALVTVIILGSSIVLAEDNTTDNSTNTTNNSTNTNTATGNISLSLACNKTEIVVGDDFEVAVNIDTAGSGINGIQFGAEFPNDVIEGLQPNPAGSLFPMVAQSTPTSYVAGAFNAGATGKGLVTTLRFKAKTVGTALINVKNFTARGGATADLVGTIPSTTIEVTIVVQSAAAPATATTPATTATSTPQAPVVVPQSAKPQTDITATPTQSSGSQQEVTGDIGAQPEDAPKVAQEIKGTSSNMSLLRYSLIPTILLLFLVVWLGIKLYFTERKRHFELEKAFEAELSTLSTLESKMDMLTIKNEDAKQQYLEEFEKAKEQIKNDSAGK